MSAAQSLTDACDPHTTPCHTCTLLPAGSCASPPGALQSHERALATLTGRSAAIRNVRALLRQVAAHDSTVLLTGESGTGKEVAARAIHDLSPRRNRPFVAVNCGAIPAELLESELFGHEKGSFTGAIAARKGRFEIAEGGTLLLDEIGDMSPAMQVKLLRVLQERVFERVGNHVPVRCNVRIIAATHRDLEAAIARGTFREDLFHRLNVFPIEMPALRARVEDLPLLVRELCNRNVAEGRGRVPLSAATLEVLSRHSWTGNVRELANLIERLSIVCAGRVVEVADLPPKYRAADALSGTTPDAGATGRSLAAEIAAVVQAGDPPPLTESAVLRLLESPPPESPPRESQLLESQRLETQTLESQTLESRPLDSPSPEAEAPAASVPELTPVAPQADDSLLTAQLSLPAAGIDLREHLNTIERTLIEQALARTNGTVAHAARLLNLRRTTLVEKLRKLGIVSD
jgi:sigma-54 dependent transcriptional regulator, flagellar regulatory protein